MTIIAGAPRALTEYPLPAARETHEMVRVPNSDILLVSHQPDGRITKVVLEPSTERFLRARTDVLTTPNSGLHGLSVAADGVHVWATVQFENALLLLDPRVDQPDEPVAIVERVDIPAPGRGPHVVREHDGDLWATLKDSRHVVRISRTKAGDHDLYETSAHPVFVAVHPTTGDVYAGCDSASEIFWLHDGTVTQIPVPAAHGATPVGLIPGPDGAVWFTLLGPAASGFPAFGRITKDDQIQYFELEASQLSGTGLLHLGFEARSDGAVGLWVLGTSISVTSSMDSLIYATFDDGLSRVQTETVVTLPSQRSKAHRVLVMDTTVLASELAMSAITQLTPQPTFIDAKSDGYTTFGLGVLGTTITW